MHRFNGTDKWRRAEEIFALGVNRPNLLGALITATAKAMVAEAPLTSLGQSPLHSNNQKHKRDPFTPALRSKGEKARNRRKRTVNL